MNSGNLKHKITFQKRAINKDLEGIQNRSWSDYIILMAQYIPQVGKEIFQEGSVISINTTTFKIRYRKDIDTTMRIISQFGIYNINDVTDDGGKHRELIISCTSEVQNG